MELSDKVANYKILLSTHKDIYDGLQLRIHQLTMELQSGQFNITNGSHACEGIDNKEIKMNIVRGLKKKALVMIEEEVLLNFMISEREELILTLKDEKVSMEFAAADWCYPLPNPQ